MEDESCSFPQYIVEDLQASPNSLVRVIFGEAGCSLGEVVFPVRSLIGGWMFSRELDKPSENFGGGGFPTHLGGH